MLIGRIGETPVFRAITAQSAMLTFRLATNELYITGTETREHTEWHNIVFTNQLAALAAKSLYKGQLIFVEGKIKNRSYTTPTGATQHITEIIATSFKLPGDAAV